MSATSLVGQSGADESDISGEPDRGAGRTSYRLVMTRSSLLRMWWAAPMALVVGSAVGVAIVIGPTVGDRVGVPHQLVVPTTGDGAAASSAATTRPHPVTTHRPAVTATHPAATPTPVASHHDSTRVVQPHRPVVTQSPDDDRSESPGGDTSGLGGHEGGDG